MNWKSLISNIAPTMATVLGSPVAGLATKALSKMLLNKDDATEQEIKEAVLAADPDTLLKIKELDAKFKTDMEKLNIDLAKIEADDRNSARQRQIALKDWVPSALACVIISGFFGILTFMLFNEVPANQEAVFNIMLGSLGAMVMAVVNYYFGSSSGSKQKNIMFNNTK